MNFLNCMLAYRKVARLIGLVLGVMVSCAGAQGLTPNKVLVPDGIEYFAVPGVTTVNGLPARLVGFRTDRGLDEVVRMYINAWGAGVQRSSLGRSIVLGSATKDEFITVKLTPSREGTQGIVSMIDVPLALKEARENERDIGSWSQVLGVGARLIDFSRSIQGESGSRSFLFSVAGGLDTGLQRASKELVSRGFRQERETNEVSADSPPLLKRGRGVLRLFRHGDGREAQILAFRTADAENYVRIHIVNFR